MSLRQPLNHFPCCPAKNSAYSFSGDPPPWRPSRGVNLTRFHDVFAPNSKHRVQVTPAKRGIGNKVKAPNETQDTTSAERRAAMTWAQRLKRVFMRYIPVPHPYGAAYGCANRLSCRFVNIDIETCRECGGAVEVIACITQTSLVFLDLGVG